MAFNLFDFSTPSQSFKKSLESGSFGVSTTEGVIKKPVPTQVPRNVPGQFAATTTTRDENRIKELANAIRLDNPELAIITDDKELVDAVVADNPELQSIFTPPEQRTFGQDFVSGLKTTLPQGIAAVRPMFSTEFLEQGVEMTKPYIGGAADVIGGIGKAFAKGLPQPNEFVKEGIRKFDTFAGNVGQKIQEREVEKGFKPESTAGMIGKGVGFIGPSILAPSIAGAGMGVGKAGKAIAKSVNVGDTFNDIAGKISTKANRFIGQKPTEDFIKMTGQTPGQFAVSRGMTKVGDEAVDESAKFFRQSLEEADNAFAAIPNKVRPEGKDVVKPMLDDLSERLTYVDSKDAPRINELKARYDAGDGLTMSEINDIKRTYSENFKYPFDEKVSKDALRSKNLQDNLRNWQFEEAEKLGLSNIAEINKNTQAWRAFTDYLAKSLSRTAGNRDMTLTDWISLSGGEPTNVALFLGKKALESKTIKEGLIKTLGKKTKEPIIRASNLKSNVPTNSVLPNLSNSGNKPVVKPDAFVKVKPSKQTIKKPSALSKLDMSKNKGGFIKVGLPDKTEDIFRKGERESFFDGNTGKVARERFNIQNLKKLGSGSDRDVYDLGDNKVLKVVKSARGLEQTSQGTDWYLQETGIVPKVFEQGDNYVVVEKVKQFKDMTKEERKIINDFIDEMQSIRPGYRQRADYGKISEKLEKYGWEELANYDLDTFGWGDIRKANLGIKNGKPILIDEGTINLTNTIENYKGVKNLDDYEFRDIYTRSKELKKQLGDIDKNTMYNLGGVMIGGYYLNEILNKQEEKTIKKTK